MDADRGREGQAVPRQVHGRRPSRTTSLNDEDLSDTRANRRDEKAQASGGDRNEPIRGKRAARQVKAAPDLPSSTPAAGHREAVLTSRFIQVRRLVRST